MEYFCNINWDVEFRSRAEEAARQFSAWRDEHVAADHAETVRAGLAFLAAAGATELTFLQGPVQRVPADDLKRATAAIAVLAARDATLASIYMVPVLLCGAVVSLAASPSQSAEMLPLIRSGRLQLAFAMTEPEAGSDAAAISTRASASNDGVTISGEKIYITGAATADRIMVVARLADSARKARAFGLYLVPAGSAGLTIAPLDKLAAQAHASCRVQLDDVSIDKSGILGGSEKVDSAWSVLRATGAIERIVVAAMAVGLGSAVLERAVGFARSREQFGQKLTEFQVIQHRLVDMATQVAAMRLFVAQAIAAYGDTDDPSVAICMAKSFCSTELQKVVASGVRIMGGRSFFEFEDMSRFYREAPFSLFAGGTAEVQKILIARGLGLL